MISSKKLREIFKNIERKAPSYELSDVLVNNLGLPGRLISGSKKAVEGEVVYWNACVFNGKGIQLWHGDISITKELDILQKCSNDLQQTIFITLESPYRFDGLDKSKEDVISIKPQK